MVFATVLVGVFLDSAAFYVLEFHREGKFLFVDSVAVDNEAVRVRKRDRFRTQQMEFLDGVLRDVAASRNKAHLALERFAASVEHFFREVNCAIARGFGTDEASAPG